MFPSKFVYSLKVWFIIDVIPKKIFHNVPWQIFQYGGVGANSVRLAITYLEISDKDMQKSLKKTRNA